MAQSKPSKNDGRIVYKEADATPYKRMIAAYKRLLSWSLDNLTEEAKTTERSRQARQLLAGMHIQGIILQEDWHKPESDEE